jgi:hypothetical protein
VPRSTGSTASVPATRSDAASIVRVAVVVGIMTRWVVGHTVEVKSEKKSAREKQVVLIIKLCTSFFYS